MLFYNFHILLEENIVILKDISCWISITKLFYLNLVSQSHIVYLASPPNSV